MEVKSNTNELRKQLQAVLKTKCDNVSYEESPTPLKYPYVVYEFSEVLQDYGRTLYKLEVNCIDYGTSTGRVEALADSIQDVFDYYQYLNDKISFATYKGQRNNVKEEDKKMKRRRLTFELHFYSKEE